MPKNKYKTSQGFANRDSNTPQFISIVYAGTCNTWGSRIRTYAN